MSNLKRYWTQDFLHLFKTPGIGFTEYETRVILTLLIEGGKPAAQIATTTEIPRTKVYDVLNSLDARGLIIKTGKNYDINVDVLKSNLDRLENLYSIFKDDMRQIIENRSVGNIGLLYQNIKNTLHPFGFNIEEQVFEISQKSSLYHATAPLGYKIIIGINVDQISLKDNVLKEIRYLMQEKGAVLGILICVDKVDISSKKFAEDNNINIIIKDNDFEKNIKYIIYELESKIKLNDIEYRSLRDDVEKFKEDILIITSELRNIEQLTIHADAQNISINVKRKYNLIKVIVHDLIDKRNNLEYQTGIIQGLMDSGRYEAVENHIKDMKNMIYNINDLKTEFNSLVDVVNNEIKLLADNNNIYLNYGLKSNPFKHIVPKLENNIIINQNLLIKNIMNKIDNNIISKTSTLSIITGTYGSGKTHLMLYLINQLNNRELITAAYTRTNKDIKEIFINLIKESNKSHSNKKLIFYFDNPSNIYDLINIINDYNKFLKYNNYESIFWFIDEFEIIDGLSHSEYSLFLDQFKFIIDSVQELGGINIILSYSTDGYNHFKQKQPALLNRIENVFQIQPLTVSDIPHFVEYYLQMYQTSDDMSKNIPEFSNDLYDEIVTYSNGNPRIMLRIFSTLFEYAINNDIDIIDSELFHNVIDYIHLGTLADDPQISFNIDIDDLIGTNGIIGYNGTGKTVLATNLAIEVAKKGVTVIIFSDDNYHNYLIRRHDDVTIYNSMPEIEDIFIEGKINFFPRSLIENRELDSSINNVINSIFEYKKENKKERNKITVIIDGLHYLLENEELEYYVRTSRSSNISLLITLQDPSQIGYNVISNMTNMFLFRLKPDAEVIKLLPLSSTQVENMHNLQIGTCYVVTPSNPVQLLKVPYERERDYGLILSNSSGENFKKIHSSIYQSESKKVIARFSKYYERSGQNYWYALTSRDIEFIEDYNITHLAYICANSGVVFLPVELMLTHIDNGDLTRTPSEGPLRHHHIIFSEEGNQMMWVQKNGVRVNIEKHYRRITDSNERQ